MLLGASLIGQNAMLMSPRLRKFALTVHLTASVGWLGTVVAFLPLAIAAVTAADDTVVRAACVAMRLMVSYAIVPFACIALLTGLVSALGTKWGLIRHYWVVIKLVLTIVATAVLLVQVAPIEALAEMAVDVDSSLVVIQRNARRPLIHAAGGLFVLLVTQALGVYKPRGVTPSARRQLTPGG